MRVFIEIQPDEELSGEFIAGNDRAGLTDIACEKVAVSLAWLGDVQDITQVTLREELSDGPATTA